MNGKALHGLDRKAQSIVTGNLAVRLATGVDIQRLLIAIDHIGAASQ